MSCLRINIYLNLKTFFKSISSQVVKKKRIEKLIQQNSKKKIFYFNKSVKNWIFNFT